PAGGRQLRRMVVKGPDGGQWWDVVQAGAVVRGSPAAAQAVKPPMMSVALCRPRSWSAAAARDEVYPSWQKTTTGRSYRSAMGSRAGQRGSNRHSRTFRSITRA